MDFSKDTNKCRHVEQHVEILHYIVQAEKAVYHAVCLSPSRPRGRPEASWAARGPTWGGGGGSPKRLYKAQTDNTKPQQTIQRHKILDKTSAY